MPSNSVGYLYSNKQSNDVVYIFIENINIRQKPHYGKLYYEHIVKCI